MYLGTAARHLYHNNNKSFGNRSYDNETTLSKYVWEIKDNYNEMLS